MAKKPTERDQPNFKILRSPYNVGPIPGDVTPDYNVPPKMTEKDPLGYLPGEQKGKGK